MKCTLCGWLMAISAAAQTNWSPPKTPWGDPDLQGVWPSTTMLMTPFERDPKLGTRAVLNDQEFAERAALLRRFRDGFEDKIPSAPVNIGAGWADYGTANRQASLIVDPADGRMPPLTAEAAKREAARRRRYDSVRLNPESWEDLNTWDRCITLGVVGSILPWAYNNGTEIVQAPGTVVIRNEMIHEARVVPLNATSHLGAAIRQYMGDSIGRWEGNTLVVETTNFNSKVILGMGAGFEGMGVLPTTSLRTVERFTRIDEQTIQYQATIEDPGTWIRPWTVAFPLRQDPSYRELNEYACHEGNLFMTDVLRGARRQEETAWLCSDYGFTPLVEASLCSARAAVKAPLQNIEAKTK